MAPTLRRDTVAVHPWLRRHLLAFPCREHIDPNSTISGSNMSLRAPGDGATPMTRSQSEGRAERHGGGAGAADHVPVGADVEREVRDDQQDRGDRREPEERGDLDFGPPASPSRDDICRTPLALGQTHPLARNEFGIAGTSHGPAPFRVTSSGTSNTDARTVAHMTHPYAAM
jgi:hypothetical protein